MNGRNFEAHSPVCVIIPTYNRAHYLAQAIDSVLAQKYENLSIIVVDDGSTDETAPLLRSYGSSVKTIRQPRSGPGKARNAGLEMALHQCRYIAFLDSDDIWRKSKIQTQVAIMESLPRIGFLFSDFSVLKDKGLLKRSGLRQWGQAVTSWDTVFPNKRAFSSLVPEKKRPGEDFTVYWGDLYTWLLRDPYVLPSSAMIRHECIENGIRFPEGVYLYEDWDFFARIARTWPGGLMDVETTINRGHDDEIRLTRCNALQACESRMALIERVWRKDPDYMERNKQIVLAMEGKQLLTMAKEYLLQAEPLKSRWALKQWKRRGTGQDRIKAGILSVMAHIPWGCSLARGLRQILGFSKRWH